MLFTPIKPMVLSKGKEAFDNEDFIFEPKMDGWRIVLHKQGDRVEAYTKSGNVITSKFPELTRLSSSIKAHTAVLDCEGICMRGERPVFDDFSYRGRLSDPKKIAFAQQTHPANFVVFDVLFTDLEHLHEPLMQRKQRLSAMIEPSPLITPITFIETHGKALSALTVERDLEGIVAKKKDSKYVPGVETKDWIKIKNYKTIDTVILGYRTKPQFGIFVGLHFRTIRNKPVAIVEHGFTEEEKQAFLEIASRLHTVKDQKAQWIEPVLCCTIQYLDRTDLHQLRTTSFMKFLPGKKAEDCIWIP